MVLRLIVGDDPILVGEAISASVEELVGDGDRSLMLELLTETDYRNDDTLVVDGQISLTATLDVLRDLAQGQGPENSILALGYAGWGPGQLEAEFQDNAWLLVPASRDLVFKVANSKKWERAFNSIGIDLSALSGTSGRA